jgi:hypothetical protein
MAETRRDASFWILGALGLLAGLNGLFMIFASEAWFARVAADTGPYNAHLVRDYGEAYLTAGLALLGALWRPAWRAPFASAAALILGLHAVAHVFESAHGHRSFVSDLPGVHLPALLVTWYAVRFWLADARVPQSS